MTHSYSSAGTFDATLTVSDGSGTDTSTQTVEVAGAFNSVYSSSILPFASSQRQNVTFVLGSELSSTESVYVVFDDPQQTNPLQITYGGSTTVERGPVSLGNSNFGTDRAFVRLDPSSGSVSAGTPIELRLADINASTPQAQTDPYDVTINRTDIAGSETNATFEVSYGTGDAALSSVSATNLTAGTSVDQTISFTPDREIPSGGRVYIDLSLAQNVSGSRVEYNNSGGASLVTGPGSAEFINTRTDEAYLQFKADSGSVSAGTTLEIEITDITAVLDGERSKTFRAGFSRGDADTTNTTFQLKNDPSAIQFTNVDNFQGDATNDEFTIDQVQVQDADNNDNLDRVVYEVTDPSGTVVASRTDDASASADITDGTTYTLNVTAFDQVGNRDNETRTTTAAQVLQPDAVLRSNSVLEFTIENVGDQQVTIEQFEVDTTAITPGNFIDDGNDPEVEIRGGQQNGIAGRNGNPSAFQADGTRYDLVTDSNSNTNGQYAVLNPGDRPTVDMRQFDQRLDNGGSNQLQFTDSPSDADVVIVFVLNNGSEETFYLEQQ